MGRPSLAATVTSLAAAVPARDRCLPVAEALSPLLPDAGLARGRIVGCNGPAAWSLALALVAQATVAGSWVAVVGAPALGVEAAGEYGVALGRMVFVATDRSPAVWADRVAAAADGFELIVTAAPPGAERMARRVGQRLQARGAVLLAVDTRAPSLSCDVTIEARPLAWSGIEHGAGRLIARRVAVCSSGRRMPRPVECELLLPGPAGCIETIGGATARGMTELEDAV